MSRTLGTVVRGVRAPIFREGDSVVDITVSTVLNALAENNITARDGDVVAVTESVVARCQGNYATCEQIAEQDCGRGVPHPQPQPLLPAAARHRHGRGEDRAAAELSL